MTSEHEHDKPPILLVDDEPEILTSLKGLLRREFTLFTTESGSQALEILKDHSIHVIMTDQRMPNMTGSELLIRAKELSPDSIRIVFTGYADIKAVVDAVNHGQLYRYITKPWDPDELIQSLREAADEYARRQRRLQLLGEVKSFLDESLQPSEAIPDATDNGKLQERGEVLRSQIQREIELYDAPT